MMSIHKFRMEDFEVEKLSKNQQKAVRGGDEPQQVDPGKAGHGGGGGAG